MRSLQILVRTALLFLYGFITVVICSAIWNSEHNMFISVVAALLLGANIYVIYRKAKALSDDIKLNGWNDEN